MIRWVRRIAFCIGAATFFVLFAVGAAAAGRICWEALVPVIVRALLGAGIIWVAGIVIADIIVKGIAAELSAHPVDPAEVGMVRRFIKAGGAARVPEDNGSGTTSGKEITGA